jgi:hypothetical protein
VGTRIWTEEEQKLAAYEAANPPSPNGLGSFSVEEDWFLPHHVKRFTSTGIPPELAYRAGIVSVESEAALWHVGFSVTQMEQLSLPGLLIPWPTLKGGTSYHQYRPDDPINRSRKYEVPRHTADVVPSTGFRSPDT